MQAAKTTYRYEIGKTYCTILEKDKGPVEVEVTGFTPCDFMYLIHPCICPGRVMLKEVNNSRTAGPFCLNWKPEDMLNKVISRKTKIIDPSRIREFKCENCYLKSPSICTYMIYGFRRSLRIKRKIAKEQHN